MVQRVERHETVAQAPLLPLPPFLLLRLLRLLRLTRLVGVMRAVPELGTLVRGIFRATRSVLSTLLLMIVILYVFAIVCG